MGVGVEGGNGIVVVPIDGDCVLGLIVARIIANRLIVSWVGSGIAILPRDGLGVGVGGGILVLSKLDGELGYAWWWRRNAANRWADRT